MLNVYFGDMPDVIYNTNVYFNNTFVWGSYDRNTSYRSWPKLW